MKRQLGVIHWSIVAVLLAVTLALVVIGMTTAAPSSSPPELATATVPAPDATIDPYAAPVTPDAYPGPYPAPVKPAYLPIVQDGESYP